jgi:hypothetical protein
MKKALESINCTCDLGQRPRSVTARHLCHICPTDSKIKNGLGINTRHAPRCAWSFEQVYCHFPQILLRSSQCMKRHAQGVSTLSQRSVHEIQCAVLKILKVSAPRLLTPWQRMTDDAVAASLPAQVQIPVSPSATSRLLYELLGRVRLGFLAVSPFRIACKFLHWERGGGSKRVWRSHRIIFCMRVCTQLTWALQGMTCWLRRMQAA